MRVAIFGDVGGHLAEFGDALVDLGCDPTRGTIPLDLTIVQVGDLIHRGPNSRGVVAMVERFHKGSPDRWVQLMGNHESLYILGETFQWDDKIDEQSAEIIRSWWSDGWMRLAYSFDSAGMEVNFPNDGICLVGVGQTLVTHAGLTAGLLINLGNPKVSDLAKVLNDIGWSGDGAPFGGVFAPGLMMGLKPQLSSGVIWAEATGEVYESWARASEAGSTPPTLHQVHGHSIPFYWGGGSWGNPLPYRLAGNGGVRVRARAIRSSRQTVVEVGSNAFFGIDPGNDSRAKVGWEPLVLEVR